MGCGLFDYLVYFGMHYNIYSDFSKTSYTAGFAYVITARKKVVYIHGQTTYLKLHGTYGELFATLCAMRRIEDQAEITAHTDINHFKEVIEKFDRINYGQQNLRENPILIFLAKEYDYHKKRFKSLKVTYCSSKKRNFFYSYCHHLSQYYTGAGKSKNRKNPPTLKLYKGWKISERE